MIKSILYINLITFLYNKIVIKKIKIRNKKKKLFKINNKINKMYVKFKQILNFNFDEFGDFHSA